MAHRAELGEDVSQHSGHLFGNGIGVLRVDRRVCENGELGRAGDALGAEASNAAPVDVDCKRVEAGDESIYSEIKLAIVDNKGVYVLLGDGKLVGNVETSVFGANDSDSMA